MMGTDAEDYREISAQLVSLSACVLDPEVKAQLIEIAMMFDRLARYAQEKTAQQHLTKSDC